MKFLVIIFMMATNVWADNPESHNVDMVEDSVAISASGIDDDPLEPLNRIVFCMNQFVDGLIVRPAALFYRAVLPEVIREGVTNVLNNLFAPVTLANNILQGDLDGATITVSRFMLNSTVGLGGFFDVAKGINLEGEPSGFGDTLLAWGLDTGAYWVLPIIGPSSILDALGIGMDYLIDPLNYYASHGSKKDQHRWILYTREGVDALNRRSKVLDVMDGLEATSLDLYASLRSVYKQRIEHKKKQLRAYKPKPVGA